MSQPSLTQKRHEPRVIACTKQDFGEKTEHIKEFLINACYSGRFRIE